MVINGYRDVLTDEESLGQFLRTWADFEAAFCDAMTSGVDFTLKVEVRGNKGELLHCRVDSNRFRRPVGVEKRVEAKKTGNPL